MNDIACVQQLTTLGKAKETGKIKISLTMFLGSLCYSKWITIQEIK